MKNAASVVIQEELKIPSYGLFDYVGGIDFDYDGHTYDEWLDEDLDYLGQYGSYLPLVHVLVRCDYDYGYD